MNFNNYYLITIKKCQTCCGELTWENSEKIAENADNANVKWVLSENTTFYSVENVSDKMPTSSALRQRDDKS
jgi:hypothetical protein